MNDKISYLDFWDLFVDEYLPEKIQSEWLESNEEYVTEIILSNYRLYQVSEVSLKIIMKIMTNIIETSYIYFKNYNTF